MRQAHPAGKRVFVDYAGQPVELIDQFEVQPKGQPGYALPFSPFPRPFSAIGRPLNASPVYQEQRVPRRQRAPNSCLLTVSFGSWGRFRLQSGRCPRSVRSPLSIATTPGASGSPSPRAHATGKASGLSPEAAGLSRREIGLPAALPCTCSATIFATSASVMGGLPFTSADGAGSIAPARAIPSASKASRSRLCATASPAGSRAHRAKRRYRNRCLYPGDGRKYWAAMTTGEGQRPCFRHLI